MAYDALADGYRGTRGNHVGDALPGAKTGLPPPPRRTSLLAAVAHLSWRHRRRRAARAWRNKHRRTVDDVAADLIRSCHLVGTFWRTLLRVRAAFDDADRGRAFARRGPRGTPRRASRPPFDRRRTGRHTRIETTHPGETASSVSGHSVSVATIPSTRRSQRDARRRA